ncbi:MAG: pyridoxamine 5'-phosphate oxidase family protein [Blastocatellia bacterium]|nr:pyridoxamine 5'-phosphate oxidase family protein [Blastocatellia bacterium]
MINILGKRESCEMLSEKRSGRLGCCSDGEPYVVPINYLFDGEHIYIHSLPGRKIDVLRNNPHACLQVDEIVDPYNWRSVIAYGNYEEITDASERERILANLFKNLPHLTPVESKITEGVSQTIVFRLRIHKITGVYEKW